MQIVGFLMRRLIFYSVYSVFLSLPSGVWVRILILIVSFPGPSIFTLNSKSRKIPLSKQKNFNPFVIIGLAYHYHLGESTLDFSGISSDFLNFYLIFKNRNPHFAVCNNLRIETKNKFSMLGRQTV